MVKESITIHLGQAGCQVGLKAWELFCEEHGINPDGTRTEVADDSTYQAMNDEDVTYESFFSHTASGQHVPRAIFADTDPRSRDDVLFEYPKLFHPDNVIGYKQDCKNNFFTGRSTARTLMYAEDIMDRVRLAVEACSNLQGFFVFHSLGGGTGTGVGSMVLEEMRQSFNRKAIFQPVIYPSRQLSSSIVEPYNCLFGLHYTKDLVDLTLMLDNQKTYKLCESNLKIKSPSYHHLNHVLAQFISATTASLRYECELNATLPEIISNLVPFPDYRYPLLSLAPMTPTNSAEHEHFTTEEIITELFAGKNFLCDCEEILSMNRYLSSVVLLRGTVDRVVDADGEPLNVTQSTVRSAVKTGTAREMPIPFNEAMSSLRNLLRPRASHRQSLKFLPWFQDGGFKVGVINKKPHVPKSFQHILSKTKRQGALMANTTAVRKMFVDQYCKFLKLFFHKAYVWQYLEADGELDAFYEAKESVREIIDKYEKLLASSVQQENEKFQQAGQTGVRLVGRTEGMSAS